MLSIPTYCRGGADRTLPRQSLYQGPGPGNCKRAAKRNVSVTSKCNYNLAYFNLWWSRMHREGVKEEKERAQSEEASRRKERLRRMLTRRKTALLSKVTKEKKLNNQMLTEDVPLDGSNIPDYASVSKFGGEGMVVHGDIIYERSPDFKDEAAIYAQHQRFTIENDGPAPGSTVEKVGRIMNL